jgi:large repetitive protein
VIRFQARPGWLRAARARASRLNSPVNRLVAASTALAVAVALTVVAVVTTTSQSPGAPVQQWGSAAGRPHRVPASKTIAALVNGRVVTAGSAASRAAQAAAERSLVRPPKGAVPAASRPPKLKLGAARVRDQVRSLGPAAAPAAAGFNARSSRVLESQTSADRVVYQNAGGTRTAQFFDAPVNYRLPDGSWASVDTSLVAAPDGWREKAAARPETFAAYADGSPLLVVLFSGSQSVGLSVAGAAHAPGTASGDAVSYAGVRPDAGLQLVSGAGQADVTVVLESAGAPDTWVFPLELGGLTARTGPGGTIEFTAGSGQVVAVMPPGLMTDSAVNPSSDEGAQSGGVSYALTAVDGRPAVRMTLDAAWLDEPSRVFPVTVDPSVEAFDSGGTTYVESPNDADYSGDSEIDVGTWDGGTNVARSLLNFSGVASSLSNDTVLGAQLGVFNSWSYSCSPRSVDVYPVTSSWSVTGDKTYPGPSVGPSVGSKSFATGWVPLGSTVSPCPASWEGIPLNEAGTQLINGWTHGTVADDGLALGASSSDSYGWKKFTSDNATNGDPFLSVTYTPYGASYDLASSNPVEQVSPTENGQIAVTVKNTGSVTWTPGNGYELSYEVYNSKGQRVTVSPQPFTPMPANTDVAPGGKITLNATVDEHTERPRTGHTPQII